MLGFAKLLCAGVNGELAAVSAPWRRLADHLAGCPWRSPGRDGCGPDAPPHTG